MVWSVVIKDRGLHTKSNTSSANRHVEQSSKPALSHILSVVIKSTDQKRQIIQSRRTDRCSSLQSFGLVSVHVLLINFGE